MLTIGLLHSAPGAGAFRAVQGEAPEQQSTARRLPRRNIGAVPPELTEPIGVPAIDRPVQDKLVTQRITLQIGEAPLGKVVEMLSKQTALNILLDRGALQDEGITSDTPVQWRVTDARLDLALNRLLRPHNLVYIVRNGVLLITTQLQAGNELVLRLYPVADLVWVGDAGESGPVEADWLTNLMQQTVGRNSWSCVGGSGTIQVFPGNLSLAVNQSEGFHKQIASVLESLRQARASGGPVEADGEDPKARKEKPAAGQPVIALGRSEREEQIMRTMREKKISLNLADMPLSDIVDIFRDKAGMDIDLDRNALADEGVTPDVSLSITVQDLPLGDALRLLLSQLNVTWIVRDEVLAITSQLYAGNVPEWRLYPIADLVVLTDEAERWSVYDGEIVQLTQAVIAPNSWSIVGGVGTIEYHQSSQSLCVNQTQAVHEQVADFLTMLREASARLPKLARAAELPLPEKWIEHELNRVRAAAKTATQARQAQAEQEAQAAEWLARALTDPAAAKLHAELHLIEAQTAAALAETARAAAKTKTPIQPPAASAPNVCPHCKKPLLYPAQSGQGGF